MNKKLNQEQIYFLNRRQSIGIVHPYTCGGGKSDEERSFCKRNSAYELRRLGEAVKYTNENEGVLIATEDGWVCPCGYYTQEYADN